jgi:hypothetical protein
MRGGLVLDGEEIPAGDVVDTSGLQPRRIRQLMARRMLAKVGDAPVATATPAPDAPVVVEEPVETPPPDPAVTADDVLTLEDLEILTAPPIGQ